MRDDDMAFSGGGPTITRLAPDGAREGPIAIDFLLATGYTSSPPQRERVKPAGPSGPRSGSALRAQWGGNFRRMRGA